MHRQAFLFWFFAIWAIQGCISSNAFAQNTKTDSKGNQTTQAQSFRLNLNYANKKFLKFIGVSSEQAVQLKEVIAEWDKDKRKLTSEKSTNRELVKAYEKRNSQCEAILTKEQREKLLRFNLINSYGAEEIGLIELAAATEDIELDAIQLEKIEQLKFNWISTATGHLKLKPITDSSDREQRWKAHEERVKKVREIRHKYGVGLRSELFELLTKKQEDRLKQIELQKFVSLKAIDVFAEEIVKNELQLTPDQETRLKKLQNEIANETDRFAATQMRLDGYRSFFNSLSGNQKQKWREKLGAPVFFFNVEWLADLIADDLKKVGD